MRGRTRWVLMIATVAMVLMTTGFLSTYVEVFEESFPAEGVESLDVQGRNGAVRLETWDQPYVWIQATATIRALSEQAAQRQAEQVQVHISRHQGAIRVETLLPRLSMSLMQQRSVEIVVRVPEGWQGDATLRTSNGRIYVTGGRGELEARTSNGSISIADFNGVLRLRTSNGRIEVTDSDAILQANTSNGRVTLERTRLSGQGWVRTSNSRIEFHAWLQPHSDYELRSSNGSINIELVDPDVRLDLRTSNRAIQVSGLSMHVEKSENRHVIGTVGSGSSRLTARTSNGRVSVSEVRAFH